MRVICKTKYLLFPEFFFLFFEIKFKEEIRDKKKENKHNAVWVRNDGLISHNNETIIILYVLYITDFIINILYSCG